VRDAVRLMRRQPRFSAVAVLLLAAGIGAAAAVFTLVNAVLLANMPFRDPDQLVWMYNARIRSAFGASRGSLARLMFRGELPALVAGIAVGLAIAVTAAWSLGDLLFATSPWDPGVYGAAAVTLFAVTAVATYLPARGAAGADAAALLRT
jgi:hypothetical protein